MRLIIINGDVIHPDSTDRRPSDQVQIALDEKLKQIAKSNMDQLVIISGRSIEEVMERFDYPGIVVGGGHGMMCLLPGGTRIGQFHTYADVLATVRDRILDNLSEMAESAGISVDDRTWSLIFNCTNVPNFERNKFLAQLRSVATGHNLSVFHTIEGHIELFLAPGFNKSYVTSYLANLFHLRPEMDQIYYVGGETSDAPAMWWTVLAGGVAVTIGESLMVPSTLYVKEAAEIGGLLDIIASSNYPSA